MSRSRLIPLFGAAIVLCTLGGVLIDVPGAAIAGWSVAVLLGITWLVVELTRRLDQRQ
ncbi:hypothetical protein [Rhodococcus sp. OK302]|jgi:hypothetical protein|uniref:hypothetical protein n=1 Tax=Rhodococcus sp. OK302 TaxID=1882769 RepID=UPI000B9F2644|nr:hypothetical protein [Rhodococcus sp. OK302]OYD60974.1 hypothetical protein BDB13_5894 [Rhodococcus sp. OK302]OYD61035.1 hypothetical protein BDB13_5963 [Rhodococcus sp. OK302]